MQLRQLFDAESSTYTYLVWDEVSLQAALIDPVIEQVERDLRLVDELGLELVYVLETHAHADHITGANEIRERTRAKTVTGRQGAACADRHLGHGQRLVLGSLSIEVLDTPGHTDDSVSYRMGSHVFTGDALFVRGTGRTDFQNGDPGVLFDSITKVLFSLPDETQVWPAHDYRGHTCSTIGEERRFNPRVAGHTREEFIERMNSLDLPEPKRIHEAVPANLACGRVGA